jgi:inorganic pyrophosphatase
MPIKKLMHTLEIIVETPKGSPFKYKYDPKKKWFEVHKMLPIGLVFPFDFGFIPDTKGEDGDPLDVLVLSEFSFSQGCMVNCNIIGSLKAEQTEDKKTIRNDRIFVAPGIKGLYPDYKSLEDIQKEKMKEIENFFIYYNLVENKTFKPIEILTAKETWKIIKQQRS